MKVAAIIQARMASVRLPGKVLMDIAGKPMLWHVVERVKKSQQVNDVIVATSTNPQDDAIANLCQSEGWPCFRGSEQDVLARYYGAAQAFGADAIVRLTGDCPLIDPVVINICVEKFIEGKHDFLSNFKGDSSKFPRGLDVRVISFNALQQAHTYAKEPYQREHVWPYIADHKEKFNIGRVINKQKAYQAQYRLTVDYPEDLELIRNIYQQLYVPGNIISILDVISLLNNHPGIAGINANAKQKDFKKA